jgi:HSP20 family protein
VLPLFLRKVLAAFDRTAGRGRRWADARTAGVVEPGRTRGGLMAEGEKRDISPAPRDWLSRWFDEWPSPRWFPKLWRSRFMEGADPIRVEEFQEGSALVVRAEMAGLDPDKDVEIRVADQTFQGVLNLATLRIHAERRHESRVGDKGHYRSEFRYGSFARTVPLPPGATDQDIKATYRDGILEIRIPIDRGKPESRKVPVQRT